MQFTCRFTVINVYIAFTQSMYKAQFYTKLCVPVDAFTEVNLLMFLSNIYTKDVLLWMQI